MMNENGRRSRSNIVSSELTPSTNMVELTVNSSPVETESVIPVSQETDPDSNIGVSDEELVEYLISVLSSEEKSIYAQRIFEQVKGRLNSQIKKQSDGGIEDLKKFLGIS